MLGMKRGAACMVVAALAGCAPQQNTSPAVYSYVPAQTAVREQASPSASQDVAAPVAAVTPPAPVPTPPPADRPLPQHPALAAIGAPDNPKAARLVGKSSAELEQLFGQAQFMRAEKTAEIRQYRSTSCVLDVFLYLESKSGTQRVEHAAVRSREGVKPDETGCLRTLLAAHWLPTT